MQRDSARVRPVSSTFPQRISL